MNAPAAVLRPVRPSDADAVWDLLAPWSGELIGMASLPRSAAAAVRAGEASGETLADLATGSFRVEPGGARRLLFLLETVSADREGEGDGGWDGIPDGRGDARPIGLTGITLKRDYPNLAVEVATGADGRGLIMLSSSEPWTRTELDSTFVSPEARGRGVGTLLSRGRFLFLHLVASQIPPTVASHLRGRFDDDGSAPFWRCFGADLAPWPTSTEAEAALVGDPGLLASLAGHRRPLTAEVLESMGPVNTASLPAFHLLLAEGLEPNGMYDPIDGGPTVVADIADTESGRLRRHGRARIGGTGPTDALVSVAGIDRFRAVRAGIELGAGTITVDRATARALRIEADALLAAAPLDGSTPVDPSTPLNGDAEGAYGAGRGVAT